MDPFNVPRRLGTGPLQLPKAAPAPGAAPSEAKPAADAGATPAPAPNAELLAARRNSGLALPNAKAGELRRSTTGNLNALSSLNTWQKDVADAIKEQTLNPDAIAQLPGKGTCVAATVQKTLARQNPELYAAIASDLALTGSASLPNGATLKVSPLNARWIEAQGLTGARKVDALLQAALMEMAAPGLGYLLASDSFATNPDKPRGLSFDQARRLIESLLKAPVVDPRALKTKWDEHQLSAGLDPHADPLSQPPSADLARKLLQGAEVGAFAAVRARDDEGQLLRDAQGRPLVEGLEDDEASRDQRLPKQSHMVQIIAKDDDAGTVTFIDALGTQRTVPATDFARILLMSQRLSELEGIGSPLGVAL